MGETSSERAESQRFPAWIVRPRVLSDRRMDASVKLVLLELVERTSTIGDVLDLRVADICALCNCCERSGRSLLKRLATHAELVTLERVSGLASRVTWTESAVRTSVRRRTTTAHPEEPPLALDAGDIELLELLGRAVARERARKLGVQVLLTSLLPPAAEGRAIARWMREHATALGLELSELAARVASAYVANDGNNGSLRACGWRLRWLAGELDRISARLARQTAPRQTAPPVEVATPPRALEERTTRARELGQFAALAKRAIGGG